MTPDAANSFTMLFSHWANGALAFGLWIGALFFFNAYRRTHDRFFVFLSLSFIVMMIDRIIWGWLGKTWPEEPQVLLRTVVYAIRFVGFLIIAFGIVDKNRRSENSHRQEGHLRLVVPNQRNSA